MYVDCGTPGLSVASFSEACKSEDVESVEEDGVEEPAGGPSKRSSIGRDGT